MARAGISYDDVQRAIEALLQRGESPSVQRIRETLGTGSFTTISDHLREWRTRRTENRDQPLPQSPPDRLQEALNGLWQQAQEEAFEALALYRKQADERIEEAHTDAGQAKRMTEDAQQRLSALGERFDQIQARLEEKTTALAHRDHELAQARKHIDDLQARLDTRDEQIEALSKERAQQEEDHQHVVAQMEETRKKQLAQEESRHETAENRLMQLLDAARQEKTDIEKQTRRKTDQLEERIDRLNQQLEAMRQNAQDEERKAREAEWKTQQAQQTLRETSEREQRQTKLLDEKERENARIKTELRVLQERLSRATLPPYI
ncbi:DNA-binding protein [Larsenimonas salina]|uniref:DNA-binding protein n=1 Tax=Larsenimonas salina TaxID=1295565 RepID=UPI002074A06A|nr:DNA-binding protein [Larsenimonas salina]MCM5703442.1 DNA-binding protein [Larsenimonas salina]